MPYQQTDDPIIREFLAGDPSSVREIRDAVEGVVRYFHPENDGLREDLVQDVLMRLLGSLNDGRFRRDASFKTYARYVAKYACLEHRRSRRKQEELDADAIPSDAPWAAPEETLLHEERHRRNLEFFALLPEASRQLFRLIFVEGLTYREVGARLGISEGTIKSRVHRMRLSFREWDGATPEPERRSTAGRGSE